jgi:hypothetical protein
LDENGQPIVPGSETGDLTKGGWVIEMVGHHFHNAKVGDDATQFVLKTLCKNLKSGSVMLPDGEGGADKEVKIADLGIKYPVVVYRRALQDVIYPAESEDAFRRRVEALTGSATPGSQPPANVDPKELEQKTFKLRRYDFVVQFMWQPTPRSAREEKEKQAAPPAGEGVDTAAIGDEATTPGT